MEPTHLSLLEFRRSALPALQEGKKGASPETAQRAEQEDVKESVKSRVVSGSQTT